MADEQLAGVKGWLMSALNMTEEEFKECLNNPRQRKMMGKTPLLMSYEIVAEAKSSKWCSAMIKPGQKFIFELMPAMVNVQKSSSPLCARAIGAIAELAPAFWDEIVAGIEPKPKTIGCPDKGLANGGFGHVEFNVYLVKKGQ